MKACIQLFGVSSPKSSTLPFLLFQAAVAEAVLRFNAGNKHPAASILQELGMNATSTGKMRTAEKVSQKSLKTPCILIMHLGHFE